MNAWKVILATLVIFIAGALTGGLLVTNAFKVEQALMTTKPARPNKVPTTNLNNPNNVNNANAAAANPWQSRNRELVRRMDREFNLTPGQHERIEDIIAAGQERTKALWKPIAPQMNREMLQVHSQIRDILTEEQKTKFDELSKPRPQAERRRNATNSSPGGLTNSAPTNVAPAIP